MPKQDGSGTGWVYVRRKKTKPNEPGRWTEQKKIEVMTTYLALGNLTQACAMCNVPLVTVQAWAKTPWWKEQMQAIRDEEVFQLDKKLEKVVNKALDQVNDRLENGELS